MNKKSAESRLHLPLRGQTQAELAGAFSTYANRLLADLGADVAAGSPDTLATQAAWAMSGAMALTGHADGPPLSCPAPLAACIQGAVAALQSLSPEPFEIDAAALLGERAAIARHHRQGNISAGGSCRILATADGYVALNLARDDDWSLLPALLDGGPCSNWEDIRATLLLHRIEPLCSKAHLLGMAMSPVAGEACKRRWFDICGIGPKRTRQSSRPLVVDLSSLWAGPLCGNLLQMAGARVIKVESTSRPDGARSGPADFFHLLNAGKECAAFDLRSSRGVDQLRTLLQAADIVIEASRPRALQQLGINAEELVHTKAGLTWISITGYGRDDDHAMRIAYGDDAGVAAGLSSMLRQRYGDAVFCADAIADPIAGAHAAVAAMAGWHSGGGYVFDISLHAVVSHCARAGVIPCPNAEQRGSEWILTLDGQEFPVLPPRARLIHRTARELGADTLAICAEFGLPC